MEQFPGDTLLNVLAYDRHGRLVFKYYRQYVGAYWPGAAPFAATGAWLVVALGLMVSWVLLLPARTADVGIMAISAAMMGITAASVWAHGWLGSRKPGIKALFAVESTPGISL